MSKQNQTEPDSVNIDIFAEKVSTEKISRILRFHGYLAVIIDQDARMIRATKFTIGYWGSVILHLGFVIIMIGALISGLTKMEGYIYLEKGRQ